ncbi:MAG: DNA helicase RecQ [Saprospiraceae bacterium]|nr:DNA helicase RecQ [Saprospiraceae bacterium]MBK7525572.1 DNA helicase RecQ [Saprospiraceae bacterium]MBK8372678.1 DNA helicase RecQ [Saprospiraceae bacterium]MBK8821001.1 DNA helicase RecQ [Saprospiraceae bacterium]MBK8855295.1 DNA helicase RecQ [Saprospiraceae bacterium]
MEYTDQDIHKSLKKYFGFETFKGDQKDIVKSVLHKNNTFVIMPTGGGKSLCYQLPAMMMEGTAIIISPLIALMKNQVDSIRGYSQEDNIASFLNSSLNKTQMTEVKAEIVSGKTKMLFIAPETLTKDENIDFFQKSNISFVAVDEAHCISEWGHDFRPEYRRIRTMITAINETIPIIALTATATPKVQTDIIKSLEMDEPNVFVSSFNRDNLYYEIRPKVNKDQTVKNIIQFIKTSGNKSGIIYVQSRKSTEDIAKVLNVNGIKAAAYHAGLDAKVRTKVQDDFLMEEVEVIVATIAFGMGIDKPDVRFVIHYDIPKSIENYYQETGRGGRDGLKGDCLAFYTYKDILKLEKFLRDKPVAERELSAQLMEEVIAYAETSSCRRKFLLHYFGEEYDDSKCSNMCDNCKYPKQKVEVSDMMALALQCVAQLNENYTVKILIEFVMGVSSKEMKDFKFDKLPLFGKGNTKDEIFWHTIFRQAILNDLLYKEIEQYGILKISDKGKEFIKKPTSIMIPLNRDFSVKEEYDMDGSGGGGAALDETLVTLLKDLRKAEGKKINVQPWVIFSEPSLQEMATYYPISMDDMKKIAGVSEGKAMKFGKPFIELIKKYVEENEIDRPTEVVIKQVANKSKYKVTIIQSIDRKMPFEDIARNVEMKFGELLYELNSIADAGTKMNINYQLKDRVDDDVLEEIFDYFKTAKTDSVEDAIRTLSQEEITEEEVLLGRLKFLSDFAN